MEETQERNALRRLNRRLAVEDKVVKKTRGWSVQRELGEYYCLDLGSNTITAQHVDVLAWLEQEDKR